MPVIDNPPDRYRPRRVDRRWNTVPGEGAEVGDVVVPSVTAPPPLPDLDGWRRRFAAARDNKAYEYTSLLVDGEVAVQALNEKYRQGWQHHAESPTPNGPLVTLRKPK